MFLQLMMQAVCGSNWPDDGAVSFKLQRESRCTDSPTAGLMSPSGPPRSKTFDRQFLVPPVVACVIAVVTLPVTLAALPKELLEATAISPTTLITVFMAAYGLTDVSRLVQKVVTAQFAKSAVGQGLVEYALILVLVAIVVIVILALLGPAIGEIFSNIVSQV
jgi:pilus assembly protein Flp/PilA